MSDEAPTPLTLVKNGLYVRTTLLNTRQIPTIIKKITEFFIAFAKSSQCWCAFVALTFHNQDNRF